MGQTMSSDLDSNLEKGSETTVKKIEEDAPQDQAGALNAATEE